MKTTMCDKCGKTFTGNPKEDEIKSVPLEYVYACSAWQVKRFDLCKECQNKLTEEIIKTKVKFITEDIKNGN